MITVTDSAVKHLQSLLAAKGESAGLGLRLFVEEGGCSGRQYGMALEPLHDGDTVITRDGVSVYVDPLSAEYLGGSELDFEDGLSGSGFKIRNPNAARTCGCGTSFEFAGGEGRGAGV